MSVSAIAPLPPCSSSNIAMLIIEESIEPYV